jgi:hypothetical protein
MDMQLVSVEHYAKRNCWTQYIDGGSSHKDFPNGGKGTAHWDGVWIVSSRSGEAASGSAAGPITAMRAVEDQFKA